MPFWASSSNSRNCASEKGVLLGGALDLDDAAGAGQHEIGVGLGVGILGVVEVEHRRALEHAAGDRGDLAGDRVGGDLARLDQALEGDSAAPPRRR